MPTRRAPRTALLSILAILIGVSMAGVSRLLIGLINLATNLAYYGRLSTAFASPVGHALGMWSVLVPIAGALIVGVLALRGSPAIRGHGIPEAMEQVLVNQSKVSPRLIILKPLSAAIAIGTGGPFGAEGPIIATGGAFGSLVGQRLPVTPLERKTLLAAGAAAGMSATFGSPVSAVLLAVELLLFEFHPRSVLPVALASAAATGLRAAWTGPEAVFAMPALASPSVPQVAGTVLLGAVFGLIAAAVTRAVYAIEDTFDHLPFHWMWWPALGAVAVGVVGLIEPRTLGVGYENIADILSGRLPLGGPARLGLLKFGSWAVALSSGTSGGTLAPLLTIGAATGSALGRLAGLDPRLAALVGMAALFAGASGAVMASAVFALETTLQFGAAAPLLGGCAAAGLVARLCLKHSIMTEKIARRGVRVPSGAVADFLDRLHVKDAASSPAACLPAEESLERARERLASASESSRHRHLPVVDRRGSLVGVVSREAVLAGPAESTVGDAVSRPPVSVGEKESLREALRLMLQEDVGRLPVLAARPPHAVVGVLTRGDLLSAYRRDDDHHEGH